MVTHMPKYRQGPIIQSLQTLEKAVSAQISFENLYFPLLQQPPSREQRRVAMDLGEEEKDVLRTRLLQNETDLHERQRKVDATAFIKLKTIGHGTCLVAEVCPSSYILRLPCTVIYPDGLLAIQSCHKHG